MLRATPTGPARGCIAAPERLREGFGNGIVGRLCMGGPSIYVPRPSVRILIARVV
jgi:hypothetical protein